jgi:UDP-N-acetylmuramate dehydrogenase
MLDDKVSKGEPLARHTTLRIGGPAEYFVRTKSRDELMQAVHWGRERHLEIFILGNGSNILVRDNGIRGLVIENHADAVHEEEDASGEKLRVVAESGASLPGLANRLARKGWRGLEWAIGVPATVGAAVVTNAGAHGRAMSDALRHAEILDADGNVRWWAKYKLEYDYRTSFLKQNPNEFVVLRAELELERDGAADCIARMNQYTEHRRRTQPTEPSVGSMFKNPPGDYAGRLIEQAGMKGARVGKIEVSRVHANFFVNTGGGTAAEVIELVERVRQRVRAEFGVELELEIEVTGDERRKTDDERPETSD